MDEGSFMLWGTAAIEVVWKIRREEQAVGIEGESVLIEVVYTWSVARRNRVYTFGGRRRIRRVFLYYEKSGGRNFVTLNQPIKGLEEPTLINILLAVQDTGRP